jgi:imidazolonepropionase
LLAAEIKLLLLEYGGGEMGNKLFIKNASELVTCSGPLPKKGREMNDIGIIKDGALIIEDGTILAVGTTSELSQLYDVHEMMVLDAKGKCVLPGFIDAHTHFVFAGDRAEEFSWRLEGMRYIDIMERGGGIMNTVRATRKADIEMLTTLAGNRLNNMLAMGVTTVEGKSGYGLDLDTEIKQLEVMQELQQSHPVEIIPTFLGAHAIPPDYKGRSEEFIDYLIKEVLPRISEKKLAVFCDIFCEKGVFSVEESRRLLLAAQDMGLRSKIHADEIVQTGGAELAAEIGAISAEHLLHISAKGIERMAETHTIGVLLPATAFSLREPFAPARKMIDAGVPIALATDFNPGSCYTCSIPLIIALAALSMNMSPAEIIIALTANAAVAVGAENRIGSIEPGKQADLIILEEPSHTFLPYRVGMNLVETVIKKGNIVWQSATASHPS